MRLVAIAGVLVAWFGVLHAQPAERHAGFIGKDTTLLEIDDCTPDKDVTDAELRRRGGEHYQRGEVLYLQGDYTGAVKELVASYCEIPYYSILKDIGQAYERELEYAKAIGYFERFVMAVPRDAKPANACAADPQEDKANMLARINVLSNLKAKIRVQTTPADARVALVKDGVTKARGTSGDELEVIGGPYQLIVERDGYHPITQLIHAEIGKPYTFFEQLEPLKGHLKIRVIPADARLFLDNREVATGSYETVLPGGRYTIQAEAQDRITSTRQIEVLPDKDTTVSFELARQPEFGRKQLLLYGGIAGGASGGLLAGQQSPFYVLLAGGGGVAAGLFGVYYGTPKDLALGTSSLTVTSSLVGGVIGGALGEGLSNNRNDVTLPLVGGGLLIGAVAGYYTADYSHPTPGDSAVINSGALWGTVAGGLFTISFDPGAKIGAGIVLSGLGMGTLGGVLLQRYFTVGRGHAALIDAAGVVGMVLALATENLADRAEQLAKPTDERTSNYALGGLATGLILGGILTRNMDDPQLAITPIMSKATASDGSSTTTFGIGGTF